jgi:hypothetical protein
MSEPCKPSEDPSTALTVDGVLVIDETGDRKDGHQTAHVGLRELGVGYVLALKPSHEWWHRIRAIGSFQEAARSGRWKSEERPGKWAQVTRTFRDGSSQQWWALEVITGPYGPSKKERVVIATTDPLTLPDLTTFYLVTNLPAAGSQRAQDSKLAAASLEEVVRLYGLRMWVEQSYKHVKHELGWSQYQARSDRAIRRHWQLVCCAFSFCWYHASHVAATSVHESEKGTEASVGPVADVSAREAETGGKKQRRTPRGATVNHPWLARASEQLWGRCL